MLSRAIIAPRDLIRDTPEAQRIALLFDHILVWQIDRKDVGKDEAARTENELTYLREQGLALKVGFDIPPIISFQSADGTSWSPFDFASKDCDLVLPFHAVGSHTAKEYEFEHEADRVVYGVARQLMYNDTPVIAHAKPKNLVTDNQEMPVALEVTLKGIPLPAENMPWDDFLQFRNDPENSARLRALRLWLQRRGTSIESERFMQEELEALLHDYRTYMKIQKIKYGDGIISTLVTSTAAVVSHTASLNFGLALKSILDIRTQNIALTEAELKAPGREVSYIARAQDWLNR